jgi:hypothetical protein
MAPSSRPSRPSSWSRSATTSMVDAIYEALALLIAGGLALCNFYVSPTV